MYGVKPGSLVYFGKQTSARQAHTRDDGVFQQIPAGGGGRGRETVPAADESVRAGGALSRVLIAVSDGIIDPSADPLFGKSATRAPTQPEQVPCRIKRCATTGGGDVATLPQLIRTMPRQPRGNKMF